MRAPDAANRWAQLNRFVDRQLSELPQTAALLWFVLFRHAKPDGHVTFLQRTMAKRLGCSERAIRRGQHELEQLGYLTVIRRGRLNVGATIAILRASPRPDVTVRCQPDECGQFDRTLASAVTELNYRGERMT